MSIRLSIDVNKIVDKIVDKMSKGTVDKMSIRCQREVNKTGILSRTCQ